MIVLSFSIDAKRSGVLETELTKIYLLMISTKSGVRSILNVNSSVPDVDVIAIAKV